MVATGEGVPGDSTSRKMLGPESLNTISRSVLSTEGWDTQPMDVM